MNFKQISNDYISGQKFINFADLVFIANIPNIELNNFSKDTYKFIFQNELYTTIKRRNINLHEGDIIYCSSNYLELLFHYLNKVELTNLILISSQSDRAINKKLYQKKPKCISHWFSINVDYENPNLIQIPLGIANEYSPKNIRISDLKNIQNFYQSKENQLYINYQVNTNASEREDLYELFKGKTGVIYKLPNLSIDEYIKDLSKYKFILCPWGNGIDTHRLWEALYLGGIPVTKHHIAYDKFKDLPIIFVENYEEITFDNLLKMKEKLKNKKLEMLNFSFWQKFIQSYVTEHNKVLIKIKEKKLYEFLFWNKLFLVAFIKSKLKIFKYYLKKIKEFF